MNLLLLCAGEGTRFRPHTHESPKPAIPFLGIPLACYSLAWARELPVRRLVVNTYHLPGKIHELFHRLPHGIPELRFSDEAPRLMGSGGALAKAASSLEDSEHFLVMNGDEVFLPARSGFLREAIEAQRSEDRLSTLFVMEHPEVGRKFGGVWTDGEKRVLGFGKTALPGAKKGWHFIGAALHSKRLLKRLSPEIASNILYDDLSRAIAEGESVRVHPVQGWWQETGNEVDYLEATAGCLRILAEKPPESALLLDALSRFAGGSWSLKPNPGEGLTLFHQGASVSSGTVLEGFNVLGKDVEVKGESRLKNVVLQSETEGKPLRLENRLVLSKI